MVSPLVSPRIESYWSKYVLDKPGLWKSFFQNMADLEIFSPNELTLQSLRTLQMNGIVICSYQTETVGHLIGLTLRTSYPIFMKLQTT